MQLTARGMDLRVGGIAVPDARLVADAEGLAGATRRVRVTEAAATADGVPIALSVPANLEWRGDTVVLAPTRLTIGTGKAAAQAELRGNALTARVRIASLPVALVAPDIDGTVSGGLEAEGTLSAPRVAFRLTTRDLLDRLAGEAEGEWRGGRLDGRVELAQGRALRITAQGSVRLPGDGALDASLHADGDVEKLVEALPLGAHMVGGRIEAAATASGTVTAPRLDGRAVLSRGRYENLDSGTLVTPLQAEVMLEGERVRVTATGGDGGRGSLRLDGSGTVAGDYEADMTLDQFIALRRDDVEATVNGTLRLSGGRLAGRLDVPRAEVDVGRFKGGGPVHLEVVEINRPGPAEPVKKRRPQRHGGDDGPALELAVEGTVAHAFVRGRGLDSEWRGDLQVSGTTAQPSLTGRLSAVRGQLDVLGKAFRLADGSTVTFQGGTPPNPALDVTADAGAADITAQVRVTGTANAPEMAFTSSPPLPQDEVLARLLFGREAGKLSAFQQIQLAQVAAGGLTGHEGGGFDPVAELRTILGLDVLGFGSQTGPGGKENPTLSAGRYIGRDTFVRVDQGTTGLGRVTVEQGVGAGFSVESYVGEQSGGGVGLTWRKDY